MAISLDGISHLSPEFQTAFQKAVQAEKKPLDTLVARKETLQSKVTLLNDVIGKVDGIKKLLPDMSTSNALMEIGVNSTDDRVAIGKAEKGKARPGHHDIEVLQLARPAAAVSNAFEDRDETRIGTGYFTIVDTFGDEKEIFVDNDNATLDGIARLINSARVGVRASVITDETDPEYPFRLMITSDKIGAENNLEYPEFYFVDGEEDFYMDIEREAANAKFRYEGMEMETTTNEINDLIPGVSLSLRGVGHVMLNVEQDTPATAAKIKGLVDGLNQVFTFVQQQNKLDEKSDTKNTLGGDYGIRMSETRLRSALQAVGLANDDRALRALGDIGIQFNRNGTLNYDANKVEAALRNQFDAVADLLVGTETIAGIVPRLSTALGSISGTQGAMLTQQRSTFNDRMKRLDKDIGQKEKLIEKRTESLKKKLSEAQGAIEQIKGQTGAIAQALLPSKGLF